MPLNHVDLLRLGTLITLIGSAGALAHGYFSAQHFFPTEYQQHALNATSWEEKCNSPPRRIDPYTGDPLSCPQGILILVSGVFIGVLVCVSLFMNMACRWLSSVFNLIDSFGNIVCGILAFGAGVSCICFAITSYYYQTCNYKCKTDNDHCKTSEENCRQVREDMYQPVAFIIGGVFAILSGYIYLATGCAICDAYHSELSMDKVEPKNLRRQSSQSQ